jgi:hypothetical protein
MKFFNVFAASLSEVNTTIPFSSILLLFLQFRFPLLFFSSNQQARSVREKAMNGQITDAERRTQAAAMAKKFSDLLNLHEDSGDDEEDS